MKAYRVSALKALVSNLLVPSLTVLALLRLFRVDATWVATITLVMLAVPGMFFLRVVATDLVNRYEARRLGAQLVPVAKGKLPGNIDLMMAAVKAVREDYLGNFIEEMQEELKSPIINLRFLWSDLYVTKDVSHIKYIFATGHSEYDRGDRKRENLGTFFGRGIFVSDGDEWKMHRTMTRPFFVRERLTDFETFERHTAITMSLLIQHTTLSATNFTGAVDFQDLVARFTLDAASEFLFGFDTSTLSKPLPVAGKAKIGPKGSAIEGGFGEFAQAFEDAQITLAARGMKGVTWQLAELFNDKTAGPIAIVQKWLMPIVKDALDKEALAKRLGETTDTSATTLLGYLVNHTDDVDLIRDELLNVLLAGRDTTAALLTCVVYFMAMHPNVLTRMREEVLHFCGDSQAPTYDTIRNMKYMRAVLNETLRLFPPVPADSRQCTAPRGSTLEAVSTYTDGIGLGSSINPKLKFYVPGGTVVLADILHMQRSDVWGPDSEVFDPDRWLDERLKNFTSNPMMFLPFIAGPRICLGQQYAYNEASYFLCRLLQNFRSVSLTPEYQPEGSTVPTEWKYSPGRKGIEKCWPLAALTLYMKGGLWVRFERA